jgi:Flp pilus assembly protein TadG
VTLGERSRDPGAERGSATVWLLALLPLLLCATAAAVLVASAVIARHRAALAADQAALAAAARAAELQPLTAVVDVAADVAGKTGVAGAIGGAAARAGSTLLIQRRACAAARATASANGAHVTSCTLIDGVADVSVAISGRGLLGRFGGAHGRARAGPAGPSPTFPAMW